MNSCPNQKDKKLRNTSLEKLKKKNIKPQKNYRTTKKNCQTSLFIATSGWGRFKSTKIQHHPDSQTPLSGNFQAQNQRKIAQNFGRFFVKTSGFSIPTGPFFAPTGQVFFLKLRKGSSNSAIDLRKIFVKRYCDSKIGSQWLRSFLEKPAETPYHTKHPH